MRKLKSKLKKPRTAAQKFAASGGRARAAKLSPERLSEIGKAGAKAKWERFREILELEKKS